MGRSIIGGAPCLRPTLGMEPHSAPFSCPYTSYLLYIYLLLCCLLCCLLLCVCLRCVVVVLVVWLCWAEPESDVSHFDGGGPV